MASGIFNVEVLLCKEVVSSESFFGEYKNSPSIKFVFSIEGSNIKCFYLYANLSITTGVRFFKNYLNIRSSNQYEKY